MPLAAAVISVPSAHAEEPSFWHGSLLVGQGYTDNIRSQAGPRRDSETYTNLAVAVGWTQHERRFLPTDLGVAAAGRVFYRFPEFNYAEFGPVAAYRFRRTELQLGYRFTPRRLLFDREEDGGPGVYFVENLLAAEIKRKFGRRKRLRAELGVQLEWRDFEPPDGGRDSFTPEIAVALRYHVASFLLPRIAAEYAPRDARGANFDRDEVNVGAGFDARLPWGVITRLRYEHSWRDYTVGAERQPDRRRNSNFRRDDEVDDYQVWLWSPFPGFERLIGRIRYKYRDADSTRDDRVFQRHEVLLEMIYTFAAI